AASGAALEPGRVAASRLAVDRDALVLARRGLLGHVPRDLARRTERLHGWGSIETPDLLVRTDDGRSGRGRRLGRGLGLLHRRRGRLRLHPLRRGRLWAGGARAPPRAPGVAAVAAGPPASRPAGRSRACRPAPRTHGARVAAATAPAAADALGPGADSRHAPHP